MERLGRNGVGMLVRSTGLILLSVALAVTLIEAVSAGPAPRERVRAGMVPVLSGAPFIVGFERGYFREAGLEIELTTFPSVAFMIPLLARGELDVAVSGVPSAGFFNAIARGLPIRIVANASVSRILPGDRTYHGLVVRRDLWEGGTVRRARDLRGRRVNVLATGVLAQLMTALALQRDGVRLDEIHQERVPFPESLIALERGALDASYLVEPFITMGRDRGVLQVLVAGERLAPGREFASVLFSGQFAEREGPARAYMVAYLRGVRDYVRAFFGDGRGRAELVQALNRHFPVGDPRMFDRMGLLYVHPDGQVNLTDIRVQQEWYMAQGVVPRPADLTAAVDTRFLQHALSVLGRNRP